MHVLLSIYEIGPQRMCIRTGIYLLSSSGGIISISSLVVLVVTLWLSGGDDNKMLLDDISKIART